MEEQKINGLMPNPPAPFDYSKILSEFPPMLKNAHEIVENVVRLQTRTRQIAVSTMFFIFFLTCIIFVPFYAYIGGLITGIVVFIISLIYMFQLERKTNLTYPQKGDEWFRGHFVKLFYWRAYFRSTQSPYFNLNAIVPNVMSDMIFFVKDMRAILKERYYSVLLFIILGVMMGLNFYWGLGSDLGYGTLYLMLMFLLMAGAVMEVFLIVQMRRSFFGLIRKLDVYNRNMEEFWKRYW